MAAILGHVATIGHLLLFRPLLVSVLNLSVAFVPTVLGPDNCSRISILMKLVIRASLERTSASALLELGISMALLPE